MEGPRKKARMDQVPHAAIETKCANAETALEVDILVLDYLAYQTASACFASRQRQNTLLSIGPNLTMADAFLTTFKARHPDYVLDAELRFRMLLLKLITLSTQRLTRNPSSPERAALQQLRETNKHRTMQWIGSEERMPTRPFNTAVYDDQSTFPARDELERNRAHVLHSLNVPPEEEQYEDAHYGTNGCVSLLDLLPLFMQVSGASMAMTSGHLTETWMHMACEFMLQACLEQYLVVGASGTDAIDEAFAWGFKGSPNAGDEDRVAVDGQEMDDTGEIDEINDMFTDGVYEDEVEGWTKMKMKYLTLLFPRGAATPTSSKDEYSVPSSDDDGNGESRLAVNLVSHLEMLAVKHPIAGFEKQMLDFLEALSQSIDAPILVQLESGQMKGMTRKQTQDFLQDCGISVARFWEEPTGFKMK